MTGRCETCRFWRRVKHPEPMGTCRTRPAGGTRRGQSERAEWVGLAGDEGRGLVRQVSGARGLGRIGRGDPCPRRLPGRPYRRGKARRNKQ